MRKYLTKEITQTEIKCGKITVNPSGEPSLQVLDSIIILGTTSLKNAQKQANKKYGSLVQVFDTIEITKTYKLEIEKFINIATLVEEGEQLEEQAE